MILLLLTTCTYIFDLYDIEKCLNNLLSHHKLSIYIIFSCDWKKYVLKIQVFQDSNPIKRSDKISNTGTSYCVTTRLILTWLHQESLTQRSKILQVLMIFFQTLDCEKNICLVEAKIGNSSIEDIVWLKTLRFK